MSTMQRTPLGFAQRAEPESFRARTLVATLTVRDIEKSLKWYCERIGFFVDKRIERAGKLVGVSLKAGDVRILINQEEGVTGWDRVKGAGFTLHFTTTQDVDVIAEAIKKRGGTLEAGPADESGTRVLRLRDPDGFRLVISSAR
jgi:uncharacterized glyoxalase superfamily protein PhnB